MGIILTIDNSECTLTGYTRTQFGELKKILSYTQDPKSAYFSGGYAQRRYLISKDGKFPTGLLYLVIRYLTKNQCVYAVNDLRKVPESVIGRFKLNLGYEPYPEQIAAARACRELKRGIVVAPTGTGKSAIAILIINELQVRTLIVVPSLELKRQLSEGLRRAYPKAKVGGLGSDIAVENVDALDCKPLKGYDCVIIDEFHHSGAATYRKLNKKSWGGVYYKLGMTATPFRSQDHERLLLESVLSRVIYRIEYQDAVRAGYIAPLESYYLEVPKVKTNANSWAAVYSEGVVNNEPRNRIISDLLANLDSSGVSTLCLVKEIKHGEILSELTGIPFASGINEDTKELIKQFNNRDIHCLIGTTGVLGEGIDTKPCEYVILGGLGKSKNSIMQQIGRGFRKYPGKESCKVILFEDKSHRWFKAHFKTQCKIIEEEYGVIPVCLTP
jgi:superfamily II DNA or RNA helicase